MFTSIKNIITTFDEESILADRKLALQVLVNYIKDKKSKQEAINLNFICTHNSRRSHLSQIWAQTMAFYFSVQNVTCYSGGTEATAMFFKVAETLHQQGFYIQKLSDNQNPVFAVKYSFNSPAIICFSKTYSNEFNPKNNFAAILTCNNADVGCPVVLGAEARIAIKYDDPKAFDNTPLMNEKYIERSLQIAQEMWWMFKNV